LLVSNQQKILDRSLTYTAGDILDDVYYSYLLTDGTLKHSDRLE